MLDEHFLTLPLARLGRGVNPTGKVIGDIDLAHVFDGDDADPEPVGV